MSHMVSPVTSRRLEQLAAITLVLNLLDAVLTLIVVSAGVAAEANPLMEAALQANPVLFVLAKTALVSLGILLLWRMRAHRFAALAIVASVFVYGAVVAYHLT